MQKGDGSLLRNLREKEELIEAKEKENLCLNELIHLKDEIIVDQKKEIEELKKQLASTTTFKDIEITQQREEQPSLFPCRDTARVHSTPHCGEAVSAMQASTAS